MTWGSQDGAPYVSGVPVGAGRLGLLQPPRDHPARGDRPVRGLLGPRPGRRRGAVGHDERPRRHRGGREPAVNPSAPSPRAGRPRGRLGGTGRCRPRSFPHVAVQGVVPDLVLLVVVAAGPGPRLRAGAGARVRRRAAARPGAAGRPLRRPLGARAARRSGYVAGRLAASGRPRVAPVAAGGRGLLLRRHLGVRAHRAGAARPGWSASASCCGSRSWPWPLDLVARPGRRTPHVAACSRRSSPTGSARDPALPPMASTAAGCGSW